MKKTLAIILALAMCFTLMSGCGSTTDSTTGSTTDSTTGSTTPSTSTDTSTASSGPSPSAEPPVKVELSFASYLPEQTPITGQYKRIQDKVNELLGGDYLTITCYANGSLAGMGEMLDSIKSGTCDIGLAQVSRFATSLPLCAITEQPGTVFSSGMAVTAASYDFMTQYEPVQKELGGMKILTVSGVGYGAIYTKKPIHNLSDLKNMQIRATSTTAEVVKSWGAKPVTLEWSECYEAMRNNLVDGLYADGGAGALFNMEEVVDYYTYFPMYNSTNLILISDKSLAKMPQSMQKALFEASAAVQNEYTTPLQPKLETLKPVNTRFFKGIEEVTFLSEAAIEENRAQCQPILESYIAGLNAKGLEGQKAYDTFKGLLDKYNKVYASQGVIEEFKTYSDNIYIAE